MRSFNAEEDEILFPDDGRVVDGDKRRFVGLGGVALGEGRKIVLADQLLCGGVHLFDVELLLHPPDVLLFKSGAAGGETIDVCAGHGVVPGMEARMGFLHVEHDDGGGEPFVQAAQDFSGLEVFAGIDFQVGHLGQGMDAGIRAARGLQFHGTAEELFGHLAHIVRYALGVGLLLPAVIIGSVVFECELPRGHSFYCGTRDAVSHLLSETMRWRCQEKT